MPTGINARWCSTCSLLMVRTTPTTMVMSVIGEAFKSMMQCWCDTALAVLQLPLREHAHGFDFALTNHAARSIDGARERTVTVTAALIVISTRTKSSGTYGIHTALSSAMRSEEFGRRHTEMSGGIKSRPKALG